MSATSVTAVQESASETPDRRQPDDFLRLKDENKRLSMEEARRGLTRLKSRPLWFWFDIYGPCNLNCVHCGFRKDGRTSDQEVSDTVYNEVVREILPTAYSCNLGGTNWGEMTISKNFHRLLRDCLKHGVRVSLTTNGTRMNDQWVGDLADALDVVGFSMEGMDQEFEKVRGFPWKRFVDNIEKLVDTRRSRGRNFRIDWRYCAHADSIHQLPEMIRVGKRLGVDRVQVMPLVPYVREQKYKNLSYHRTLANQYFAEARAVARDLDMELSIPDDYTTGEFSQKLLKINKKSEVDAPSLSSQIEMVNCYRPWQACSINELGTVKPCCIYWRSVGTIAESGFEAVWNGRQYRALRRSINTRPDSICYDCRLPSADAESGRVAGELRPSTKQLITELTQSVLHPRSVRFNDVLDPSFDPHAGGSH